MSAHAELFAKVRWSLLVGAVGGAAVLPFVESRPWALLVPAFAGALFYTVQNELGERNRSVLSSIALFLEQLEKFLKVLLSYAPLSAAAWLLLGIILGDHLTPFTKLQLTRDETGQTTPKPTPLAPHAIQSVIAQSSVSELAPPGVFFLVTAVSVETSDGILSLRPGQMLRKVRPGIYRTEDHQEVALRDDQVTNNLRVAQEAVLRDRWRNRIAKAPDAEAADSLPSAPVAKSSIRPPDLLRKRRALEEEQSKLAAALHAAAAPYHGSWNTAAKKSKHAHTLLVQWRAIHQQIDEIDRQLRGSD